MHMNIWTDNSMENLRLDKEDYFHVLVFYGLFYKRNRKHFPLLPIRYRNTRGSLEKLEMAWKHSPYTQGRREKFVAPGQKEYVGPYSMAVKKSTNGPHASDNALYSSDNVLYSRDNALYSSDNAKGPKYPHAGIDKGSCQHVMINAKISV